MNPETIADLRAHAALCQELLALVEREGAALRDPSPPALFAFHQERQRLLPELTRLGQALKRHRHQWQQLDPAARAACADIPALLRENQELIMKILVRHRENEQGLLRRGLTPPQHLPPLNRQRPHYVTDLYRRCAAA